MMSLMCPSEVTQLATRYNCVACHTVDKKVVGPMLSLARAMRLAGVTAGTCMLWTTTSAFAGL
jgi:cytochrome c551/c552